MSIEHGDLIYHLAIRDEWRAAVSADGHYRRSTLGKSLQEEGFIHCSFAGQVQSIADSVYRHRRDVVLLTIDPTLVSADIRVENLDGGDEAFPHIYGSLSASAVVREDHLVPDSDGRLACPQTPGDTNRLTSL